MPNEILSDEIARMVNVLRELLNNTRGRPISYSALAEVLNIVTAENNISGIHFSSQYLHRLSLGAVRNIDGGLLSTILQAAADKHNIELIQPMARMRPISGFIPGSTSLGEIAEMLAGAWIAYTVSASAEYAITGALMFVRNIDNQYCDLLVITPTRQWVGQCYGKEHHLYFIFHESTFDAGSAFMICNRPSRLTNFFSGLLLIVDAPDPTTPEPIPLVRPVQAALCFVEKLGTPEVVIGKLNMSDEAKKTRLLGAVTDAQQIVPEEEAAPLKNFTKNSKV